MAIRPINGGGGAGRQTILLTGSPFATRAALITASQASPTQLFNNNTQVTIAVVSSDPTPSNNGTFEWTGQTGVYNGDFWVDFNGLDAADIKALYESNPNTNAFTNNQKTSVNSMVGIPAGQMPVSMGGGVMQSSGMQMLTDGTLLAPKSFGVESGSVSFGDLIVLSESTGFLTVNNNDSGGMYNVVDFAVPRNAPSSNPRILRLTEAENVFTPQPVFNTNLPAGNLSFNYTTQILGRTNGATFKIASAATNVRARITSVSSGVAIKYWPTKADWISGAGESVSAGDLEIDLSDTPLILASGFQLTVEVSGTDLQLLGNSSGLPYLSFMVQRGEFVDVVLDGDVSSYGGAVYSFVNASNALSSTVVKSNLPTANKVTDWNAEALNTLSVSYATTAGSKYVYFAIPSDEQITAAGVSLNSGSTWTNLTPVFKFFIDFEGVNFSVYVSSATFAFTGSPYLLRFTTAQSSAGGGIAYTGGTPANQELIVGTGNASTAQRSNITLSGGKIPNNAIGVNTVQSSNSINLNNSANWQTYRGRRIQFTGSGNYVRGIQTLPDLGTQNFMNSGDFVEVMNIGGTGNYNCQIQTANAGQFLTGALTGNGPVIGISTTTVYRITWNGSNQNWIVTSGTVSGASDQVAAYQSQFWLDQDDGSGIYTANDIEIRAGMQLQVQPFSNVCTTSNVNLNSCQFTFTDHVGAAQFFKYLSNDVSFPLVNIDQAAPSMDATAALLYLDGTVLNTSYASGKTIQPDGTGVLTQITFISGTTMLARLVMADVTNFAIGSQIRINAALNTLNNGDFVIQGFTDFAGYTIVQYTNPNASVDLDVGDTLTTVATAAPVLFWRVTAASQSTTWVATCQFALNSTFTILAELDPDWYTTGVGHVSWIDEVYQAVVAGAGGTLHTDSDIHAIGSIEAEGGMVLAGKILPNAPVVAGFGDSIYFDDVANTWKVGAPRVCDLPVPQSTLTSANYWQVLTFDNTGNMSMQFPRFAGVPTSRLDTLQNGDSVRYDSGAQTWYNSRTAGSCFARRHSVNQTIGNLTDVRVAFDTGDSFLGFNSGETGITYDGTTNVGRFTNTSGRRVLITVTYQIPWGINATGIRFAWIRLNGTTGNRVAYVGSDAAGSSDITCLNGAATFALDNNQFFEVWVYQGSGTSLDIGNVGGGVDTGYGTRIQITRINP